MTIGERVKKVRKDLDLTQQDFCDRIGLKRNSISLVESGKRNISDQAIKSICREFGVNETWLRTGEGDMFVETPSDTLDALAQEYGLDRFGRTVIEKMVNLSEKQWELLSDMVTSIVSSLSEDTAPNDTIKSAEAAYEKSLGFAPRMGLSASNTTDGTASPSYVDKEKTTTKSGGGENGNNVG